MFKNRGELSPVTLISAEEISEVKFSSVKVGSLDINQSSVVLVGVGKPKSS